MCKTKLLSVICNVGIIIAITLSISATKVFGSDDFTNTLCEQMSYTYYYGAVDGYKAEKSPQKGWENFKKLNKNFKMFNNITDELQEAINLTLHKGYNYGYINGTNHMYMTPDEFYRFIEMIKRKLYVNCLLREDAKTR